jgi:exopolyphosphatase / guanosine-5'-triphosphate,3'-diphosphate pyrophosphatase
MAGSRTTAAVLDVGCFSAHLVVVEGKLTRPVLSHKVRLELDRTMDGAGRITGEGVDHIVGAVREIQGSIDSAQISRFLPFATSSVRDAANAADVIATVARRTGVTLRFLSGRREARLAYLAVRHWSRTDGPLTVLDVGGGTVEIAFGADERPDFACSLPLGARTLTQAGTRKLDAMRTRVADRVHDAIPRDVRAELARAPGYGCSKVFQQLTTLCGRRRLDVADLSDWIPRLAAMSTRERARLPGISRHRARQTVAGAVVAEALMTVTGHDRLDVCPWSTKEGALLSLLN